jgi:membrane-associated phospholipid phosphatase
VRWEWIVAVYTAYFAIVAWTRRYPAVLKYITVAALIFAVGLVLLPAPIRTRQIALHQWLPLVVLLAGYRLSGLFFVGPMRSLERRLLAFDRRVFDAVGWKPSHRTGAPAFHALLELAYLLVYAMVPLGVVALQLAGASSQLSRYWAVVLAACFTSYAMLPWLQTRPPRVLEALMAADGGNNPKDDRTPLRRLNLAILRRSSIQVNTLPSGHVAAALAVALMVLASAPVAGLAFLALTIAIAIATVIGRYHYVVDTVAGLGVALASWWWLG